MNHKAVFKEINQTFKPIFKEVYTASSGGEDIAYERGFEAGKEEGYEQGKADEYTRFLNAVAEGSEPSGDIVITAENIVKQSFYYSPGLTGVSLPNAIKIGANAFRECDALTTVSMPNVVEIQGYAFYNNLNIKEIILPESIKILGDQCFAHCKKATRLVIGGTLSSINPTQQPFQGMSSLIDIEIGGAIEVDGLSFRQSKNLSKGSHINIINTLSSATTGMTIILSLTAVNNAFETTEGLADGSTSEEWLELIATKENWVIELA